MRPLLIIGFVRSVHMGNVGLNRAEKEWTMPPREWAMAKAQFAVVFGERFTRAMV